MQIIQDSRTFLSGLSALRSAALLDIRQSIAAGRAPAGDDQRSPSGIP